MINVVADANTTDLKSISSLARKYPDFTVTIQNLMHMGVIPGTMMSAPILSERSVNDENMGIKPVGIRGRIKGHS